MNLASKGDGEVLEICICLGYLGGRTSSMGSFSPTNTCGLGYRPAQFRVSWLAGLHNYFDLQFSFEG